MSKNLPGARGFVFPKYEPVAIHGGPIQASGKLKLSDISSVATEDISAATEDISSVATEDISSVATEDISSVAAEDISSVATEDISSVATEDISSVATEEVSKKWVPRYHREHFWGSQKGLPTGF